MVPSPFQFSFLSSSPDASQVLDFGILRFSVNISVHQSSLQLLFLSPSKRSRFCFIVPIETLYSQSLTSPIPIRRSPPLSSFLLFSHPHSPIEPPSTNKNPPTETLVKTDQRKACRAPSSASESTIYSPSPVHQKGLLVMLVVQPRRHRGSMKRV